MMVHVARAQARRELVVSALKRMQAVLNAAEQPSLFNRINTMLAQAAASSVQ